MEKPERKGKWMEKGSSPTKRLIQMKGSKWGHEKKSNEIQGQSNYTLKYTTSPQMSYVMEPKEGKIDYSKSKKKNFEDQLSQQHIIKHKV